jgi:tetratricopeptide (TPR) repeat protein
MPLFQPVSPRRRRFTLYLLGLGLVLVLATGANAVRDYQRFERADALRERAHQCADSGRNPEAIELYEACVREYAYFMEGWTSLSELYFEKGDHVNAQRCLDQALVYCPETPAARAIIHRERGSLFLRLRQVEKARGELALACSLDPTDDMATRLRLSADESGAAPVKPASGAQKAHEDHAGHEDHSGHEH